MAKSRTKPGEEKHKAVNTADLGTTCAIDGKVKVTIALADETKKGGISTPKKIKLNSDPDLYFHSQAAEQISNRLEHNKYFREEFAKKIFNAIHEGQITAYSHQDGTEMQVPIPFSVPLCVRVKDVNFWLKNNSYDVFWNPENRPTASMSNLTHQSAEVRQAERWKLCEVMGLKMPTDTYRPFPRGIGKVAKQLGIKRQTLTEDLNKYRERA